MNDAQKMRLYELGKEAGALEQGQMLSWYKALPVEDQELLRSAFVEAREFVEALTVLLRNASALHGEIVWKRGE